MFQVPRSVAHRSMLLFIVRHGDSDMFRWLRQTFAGQPVWISWDRHVRQRRRPGGHVQVDRRPHERRDNAYNLKRLRFIALTLSVRSYRQAS